MSPEKAGPVPQEFVAKKPRLQLSFSLVFNGSKIVNINILAK
jgi:hypothetical protein